MIEPGDILTFRRLDRPKISFSLNNMFFDKFKHKYILNNDESYYFRLSFIGMLPKLLANYYTAKDFKMKVYTCGDPITFRYFITGLVGKIKIDKYTVISADYIDRGHYYADDNTGPLVMDLNMVLYDDNSNCYTCKIDRMPENTYLTDEIFLSNYESKNDGFVAEIMTPQIAKTTITVKKV